MNLNLEDELTAGLHERAAGVHLTRDVLDAARRRHRRRTTVTRAVAATGTAGLASAVAAAVAMGGPATVTATPPGTAASPGPAGVALDAATVSARISRALTDVESKVTHIRMRVRLGGESSRMEVWQDTTTGDQRVIGRKAPDAPRVDMSYDVDGDRVVSTYVDHDRRVWWRETQARLDVPDDEAARKGAGPLGDFSPEGLRRSLRAGDFTVVGEERLGGRDTVHLRVTDVATYGGYDLWVDAGSYVLVRRVVDEQRDDPDFRVQEDYAYLPRTGAVLAELKLVVPRGFEEQPEVQVETGPAPAGGTG
jgi:hypothetical protein